MYPAHDVEEGQRVSCTYLETQEKECQHEMPVAVACFWALASWQDGRNEDMSKVWRRHDFEAMR